MSDKEVQMEYIDYEELLDNAIQGKKKILGVEEKVSISKSEAEIVNNENAIKIEPTTIGNWSTYSCNCPQKHGVLNLKCPEVVHILDNYVSAHVGIVSPKDTLPKNILEIKLLPIRRNGRGTVTGEHEEGVFALVAIPEGVSFGPYFGIENIQISHGQTWLLNDERTKLKNVRDESKSNWIKYVRYAHNAKEYNLEAYHCEGYIYYESMKRIKAGDELIVFYGEEFLKYTTQNSKNLCYYQPVGRQRTNPIYGCMYCCLGYASEGYLRYHITRCSSNDNKEDLSAPPDIFECPNCGLCIYGIQKKHEEVCYRFTLLKDKRHVCDVCGECFDCNVSLKKHLDTYTKCGEISKLKKHRHSDPIVCKKCGKRFTKTESLKVHMLLHSDNSKAEFQCDQCDMVFLKMHNLEAHSTIHSKLFRCHQCGLKLKNRGSLKNHILLHTGRRPFVCDQCGEGFRRNECLKRHLDIHSGMKPFKCDLCGKQFVHKHNLRKHMFLHSSMQLFTCDKCGIGFKRREYLRLHINVHRT